MVRVSKKALKIGAAGIAVSAVAIGLGVGLSKKNTENRSTSASQAMYGENLDGMCRRLIDGRDASPINDIFEKNLRDLQWGSDGYSGGASPQPVTGGGSTAGVSKGASKSGSAKGSKGGSAKGSKGGSAKGSKGGAIPALCATSKASDLCAPMVACSCDSVTSVTGSKASSANLGGSSKGSSKSGSAKGSKSGSAKGSSKSGSAKGSKSGSAKAGSAKAGSSKAAAVSGGSGAAVSGGSGAWRSDGFDRDLQWGSDGHSAVSSGGSTAGVSKGTSKSGSAKGSKGGSAKGSKGGSAKGSKGGSAKGSKGSGITQMCSCPAPIGSSNSQGGYPVAPSICNIQPPVPPPPTPVVPLVPPTTPAPTPCDEQRFFYVNEVCTNEVYLMGATSYGSAMECCEVNMGGGSMISGGCSYVDSCNPQPLTTPPPTPYPVAPLVPPTTPAPTPCEAIPFYFSGGVCSNSGTVMSGATGPFITAYECCEMSFGSGSMSISSMEGGCSYVDSCNPQPLTTPPPTPYPVTPLVPPTTPAPTPCEARAFYFDGTQCSNEFFIADAPAYNSVTACCEDPSNAASFMNGCQYYDMCNPFVPSPPTPSPITMLTNPPTTGSTPTVSTEVTGPPTVAGRGNNSQ